MNAKCWRWRAASNAEEIISFLRKERNRHHDHAYVLPPAVVHCVEDGQAWVIHDPEKGELVGVALGSKKTLWNLIVAADHRRNGIGSAFLRQVRPQFIRAKISSDKKIGDPTAFYEKNGWWVLGNVPSTVGRKSIRLMSRVQKSLPTTSEAERAEP